MSLKAARGHATTPERPERAFKRPDLWGDYLRRRVAQDKFVPPNTIPEQSPEYRAVGRVGRRMGSEIGHPQRFAFDQIIFYRTPGGAVDGNPNIMIHRVVDARTGRETETVIPYDEADFYQLVRLAKDRGFTVTVESTQGDTRIVA